ncbi:hypothetical protein NDU88_008326 [Pleurodeles waltl]|uniref:Uncharacterized protein n=1 Tax=Pleurodeles waltl TaxID=8319 RepID=A0AAV7QPD5_PLEWA|nr:hypothetical protein NDU88_008326 [Pleurodeles waltl]
MATRNRRLRRELCSRPPTINEYPVPARLRRCCARPGLSGSAILAERGPTHRRPDEPESHRRVRDRRAGYFRDGIPGRAPAPNPRRSEVRPEDSGDRAFAKSKQKSCNDGDDALIARGRVIPGRLVGSNREALGGPQRRGEQR